MLTFFRYYMRFRRFLESQSMNMLMMIMLLLVALYGAGRS